MSPKELLILVRSDRIDLVRRGGTDRLRLKSVAIGTGSLKSRLYQVLNRFTDKQLEGHLVTLALPDALLTVHSPSFQVGAKADFVEALIQYFQKRKMSLECLTSTSWLYWTLPFKDLGVKNSGLVLHLDDKRLTVSTIKSGEVAANETLDFGLDHLIADILSHYANSETSLKPEQVKQALKSTLVFPIEGEEQSEDVKAFFNDLAPSFEQLFDHIQAAASKLGRKKAKYPIFLTGHFSYLPGVERYVAQHLGLPKTQFLEHFLQTSRQAYKNEAVYLLGRLGKGSLLNLTPKTHQQRHVTRKILTYSGIGTGLLAALLIGLWVGLFMHTVSHERHVYELQHVLANNTVLSEQKQHLAHLEQNKPKHGVLLQQLSKLGYESLYISKLELSGDTARLHVKVPSRTPDRQLRQFVAALGKQRILGQVQVTNVRKTSKYTQAVVSGRVLL